MYTYATLKLPDLKASILPKSTREQVIGMNVQPIDKQTVRIFLDEKSEVSAMIARPERFRPGKTDCIVLAHGAGTDMHHPFISYFHDAMAEAGWISIKFNFLYKEQGRKAPDTTSKLERTFVQVLNHIRTDTELRPPRLFIGGKSMGGRIASHIVANGQDVAGLIFLGYPLHAPNRHDKLRSEHLKGIGCPMLFVEGTKDPFCRLDLLAETLAQINAPTETYLVEGGNHDFRVPKRLAQSPEQIWQEVAAVISETLRRWVVQ